MPTTTKSAYQWRALSITKWSAVVVIVLLAVLLLFSKSRNRIKSDEFIHWTDQEVITAYDTTTIRF